MGKRSSLPSTGVDVDHWYLPPPSPRWLLPSIGVDVEHWYLPTSTLITAIYRGRSWPRMSTHLKGDHCHLPWGEGKGFVNSRKMIWRETGTAQWTAVMDGRVGRDILPVSLYYCRCYYYYSFGVFYLILSFMSTFLLVLSSLSIPIQRRPFPGAIYSAVRVSSETPLVTSNSPFDRHYYYYC